MVPLEHFEREIIMAPNPKTEPERQLRIKLPLRYHMDLHELKLVSGKSMARIVQDALDCYFAMHEAQLGNAPVPEAEDDGFTEVDGGAQPVNTRHAHASDGVDPPSSVG